MGVYLQGRPYAPGVAAGFICRQCQEACHDKLLVADQDQAHALSQRVAGLVIVNGNPFAHACISLLHRGIPIVFIDRQQSVRLRDGQHFHIDGYHGCIQEEPPRHGIADIPENVSGNDATVDGVGIQLNASIGDMGSIAKAQRHGARAIGLLRSEMFLPDEDRVPDAEFYTQTFTELLQVARPLKTNIRLLDLAEDKQPAWLRPILPWQNHAYTQGVRWLELPLARQVFEAQLQALQTVAQSQDFNVTLPFISDVSEFCRWREVTRSYLPNTIRIGAMAESPIAAMSVAATLEQAAFVSIGCNDLMKYLFAAARAQARTSSYLDPYHPALFRFLKLVAQQAGEDIRRIQICGLLAQLPGLLPVMIGLGFRQFSVEPVMLPYLRAAMRRTLLPEAQYLADGVCRARDTQQVLSLLGEHSCEPVSAPVTTEQIA